jgi:exodeoxyribonuclease VIII
MNDIMVDLETMGKVADSAIASIGAVECNLITGETREEFYKVVDLNNQPNLTINPNTLYWWLKRSDAARLGLVVEGRLSLKETCEALHRWVSYLDAPNENIRLWGNGASFDNAILRYAFKQVDVNFPIEFWNDRDMRTIVGFYPNQLQDKWKHSNYREGTHHNALADAKHQIKYCSDILKELGVKELY